MPTIPEAHSYCTLKAKDSGSNFYYSFLFLPRPRREAMCTVYTLCHELDAAVDHPPHGVDPCDRLAQWRREIEAAYQGVPQCPVTISLADHASRLGIPLDYFQELVAGMEMDLTIRRYATFDDLYPYCYRVASIVGLICLKVFGTVDPRAQDYAVNLGVAFQLTNIIRDVGADAKRDRIYVPLEDLATFGCSEEQLLSKTASPEFIRLMEFQAARAHDYYRKAQTVYDALSSTDRRSLLVAEIMRDIYFNLLTRIESTRFAVFTSRIRVPPFRRATLALTTWARRSFQNRVSRRT
ncbi:MAG: presqualene diphosphate synthase HpnD [Nitrospira sp.]|nr:presqualene diphosphate synthase HpnD [Nitrospira sp.]MDE0485758.1 presqualene diphosphate synthase HpnD [Nitrospira sp.]